MSTDLDQLLSLHDAVTRDQRWGERFIPLAMVVAILFVLVGLLVPNSFWLGMVMWVAFAWFGVNAVYRAFRLNRNRAKYYPLRDQMVATVATEKVQLAITMFGWWDGNISAIECQTCHMPGDCPLCGAA